MNALPSNVVDFKLPKKPKVKEKEALPDQRRMTVMPIRAITDKRITDGMFRTLALVCSYVNRAGITWVSQARLAKDTGTSRQAISKQLVKLRALGYIETVSKAFKGVKPDTVRVIFDPTIDAETAIAVTSSIEDTRPPEMKRQQQKELDNTIDIEGLKRINDMIKGVVKPINTPAKEYQMPNNKDTITVAKMKKEIAKHKQKTASGATLEVAPTAQIIGSHTQPHTQPPEVAHNEEERSIRLTLSIINKELNISLNNIEVNLIGNLELTDVELTMACRMLVERYQSEGLTIPTSSEQVTHDLLVIAVDVMK